MTLNVGGGCRLFYDDVSIYTSGSQPEGRKLVQEGACDHEKHTGFILIQPE
jgi:hypothetical protein